MCPCISGRPLRAVLLLSLSCSLTSVLAQDSSPGQSRKPSAEGVTEQAPPFDQLELVAFLAAGPYPPYAAEAIRKRGMDFRPQDPFLLTYPAPLVREALTHTPPAGAQPLPVNRQQSLALVSKVAANIRGRGCAGAREDLQEAVRLTPDSAGLHFAAAACALSAKVWPQVEKECRESLRYWQNNADARILLAYTLNIQARGPEAVAEAREALRISPDHKGAVMQLGVALSVSGQHAEAIPVLRRSSALNQQATLVEKYLGYSLIETNQPSQALDPLTLFLKRFPNDGEGNYLLGVALRALGRKDEAQPHFEEALRVDPRNERYRAANNLDPTPSPSDTPAHPKPDLGSVSGNLYSNKFFQFTYEFPDGWTLLSSEAGRALVEVGGAMFSTGDPIEPETIKVAKQRGYPLLTLIQRREKNQAVSAKVIQIVALDVHEVPSTDPVYFLTAITDRLRQSGAGIELLDAPKRINAGGRGFANAHIVAHVANGQVYTSQYVGRIKGFLLMINLSALDRDSLSTLESTLSSLHFAQDSE